MEMNFSPHPILETERLILRNVKREDAENVFLLRSNKEAMRFVPRPIAQSVADAHTLIDNTIKMVESNEGINFAIVEKSNPDKLIGLIGFLRTKKDQYRSEIGYMLHPDYHRRGYVLEALNRLVEYGWDGIGFHTVEAIVDPINEPSWKLLEKAGFTLEGVFKQSFFFKGEFSDGKYYSKINPNSISDPNYFDKFKDK
ncbi:hypothetical protein CYY_001246 [Polysphondylium violaceum]|uniref:N-acetyltransferase domain-containing protein n=1 Tax=Polysphondylium violaceum TaxID=133409 RepID=A0A8J4V4G2_9MYCE|nr:hypothetical protein CYY_001246 [Polysphondylium violaceum]